MEWWGRGGFKLPPPPPPPFSYRMNKLEEEEQGQQSGGASREDCKVLGFIDHPNCSPCDLPQLAWVWVGVQGTSHSFVPWKERRDRMWLKGA